MGLVPSTGDKIRNEWETIKSLKGKERWEHIWEYYKLFIIGILVVLAIIGSSVYRSVINPNPVPMLNIAWNHGMQLTDFYRALETELTNKLDATAKNERVFIIPYLGSDDPQMAIAGQMRLAAMISIGDLDIIIATEEELYVYYTEHMLLDIGSWLKPGTDGLLEAQGEDGSTFVYGVSIRDSRMLKNASFFIIDESPTPYLGVLTNTVRYEKVRQTVELLLER